MRVYRIEGKDGTGIFNTGIVMRALNNVLFRRGEDDAWGAANVPDPYRHPSPDRDVPGWDYDHSYFCCFTSLDRLVRWFDSEEVRAEMDRLGALVRVYEVSPLDVLKGDWQDMMLMERAVYVETVPMPLALTHA